MELYEKLKEYGESSSYPMHMPGHKRNQEWLKMDNPYKLDITEIDGFDDLHEPEGILKEGMERAARLYGAEESWYLINGSTAGILAGIMAATRPGDQILMARNCHKSVYHGVVLNQLNPLYLCPPVDPRSGIFGSISPDAIDDMLREHSPALVVITSPTYEGILSDVASIAEICHRHGIPLMVDEAHGAHLGFGGGFPGNSVAAGADIVVHSLHKTMPAFTQTGLIHRRGNLVSGKRIKHFLDIFQTSSPSYILMAGIDRCLHLLEEGDSWMTAWKERLDGFYSPMKRLRVLSLVPGWNRETGEKSIFYDWDPSKLVISTRGSGHSGKELMQILRDCYRIELEMASCDYVIAMTGAGDTWEGLAHFAEALLEIDQEWASGGSGVNDISLGGCQWGRSRLLPWQAEDEEGEYIFLDEFALGWVSLEFVYAYPPGIPILVPGEEVTEDVLKLIRHYEEMGIPMRGYSDQEGHRILACRIEDK
ncbi:MAG: aminotransferase class I/II-fold pyridoxal phosphate-dependent enzyme [Clostridiales bacterium]|nr:aminotransferase class I/II-fold pyridoxal phosphate-dependent enzyme [Clostridiales bacterium]